MKANKKQLVIGIAIALLLISVGLIRGISKTSVQAAVKVQPVPTGPKAGTLTPDQAKEKSEEERKQKVLSAIAEHESAIQANRSSEDTPARMMAIGNLYQYQMKDYYAAIRNYRDMVDGFPKDSQVPQAYIEIATCYERLGDQEQARYVYEEMVEKLDPTLQHVNFAKLMLQKK